MFSLLLLAAGTLAQKPLPYAGLDILKDNARINLGKNKDIVLKRAGPKKLSIEADVEIKGTLTSNGGVVGGGGGDIDLTDDLRALINKMAKRIEALETAKNERDALLDENHFVCKKGWEGQFCNADIDDCKPNPCDPKNKFKHTCKDLGGGTGKFSCSCAKGWTGATCTKDVVDCTKCSGHGKCTEGPAGSGTYSCACTGGWNAKDCQSKCGGAKAGYYWTKGCTISGCAGLKVGMYFSTHGGTNKNGCAQKACDKAPKGFFHTAGHRNNPKLCPLKDIDDCKPNPCKNGGTCKDTGPHSFKCTCKSGFTGDTCNVDNTQDCKKFGGITMMKVWQVNARGRMKMNRNAVGKISKGSVTTTAKLADSVINQIAASYQGYNRIYRLSSTDNSNSAWIRAKDAYDDLKATWGMKPGNSKICLATSYEKCGTWANMAGHGLDLLHSSPGIGGQSCQRYFLGHGGLDCWPSNGNWRCVRGGGSCRHKGGFDGRTDHVVLNDAALWVSVGSCAGKDACSSNPCKNGATCKNAGDYKFTCKCKAPWSGDTCDTKAYCQVFNGLAFAKVWQVNGRNRMKINSNAVGRINPTSSVTSTAKLSDAEINKMARGRDGYSRLYRLSTPDNSNSAWIRAKDAYNDLKPTWGMKPGNTKICLATKYQSCGTWANMAGHGLDLLHSSPGIGGQSCQRYFLGHGGLDCWPSNGNYRCVRGGGSCRHKGGFDGRTDHVVLNDVALWVYLGKSSC